MTRSVVASGVGGNVKVVLTPFLVPVRSVVCQTIAILIYFSDPIDNVSRFGYIQTMTNVGESRITEGETQMEKTLNPQHILFEDWRNLDQYESIRVTLGCNPAVAREAEGEGVTCVAFPKYKNGGFAGTGGHAGFVVCLPFDGLVEAGFTTNEIYFSEGARIGTHIDHEYDNAPVCEDCILAAGSLKGYKKIKNPSEPCWSCCQMLEEQRRTFDEHTAS